MTRHLLRDRDDTSSKRGNKKNRPLTCKPAFALCDFWLFPPTSFGPALPPVDFPFPPAISNARIRKIDAVGWLSATEGVAVEFGLCWMVVGEGGEVEAEVFVGCLVVVRARNGKCLK